MAKDRFYILTARVETSMELEEAQDVIVQALFTAPKVSLPHFIDFLDVELEEEVDWYVRPRQE